MELKTRVDLIMSQAQVYASAWALVGGQFDNGTMYAEAEEYKMELRAMIEKDIKAAIDEKLESIAVQLEHGQKPASSGAWFARIIRDQKEAK